MKYKLKKDDYLSSKKYVWKDGRCLGHVFSEVKERTDVDWEKFKQSKDVKMTVRDRLIVKFNAVSYPNESCGQHDCVEDAILAIEKKQHDMFSSLQNCDEIVIGVDNV